MNYCTVTNDFYSNLVGFRPGTRCFTKAALSHESFPVNFMSNCEHLFLKIYATAYIKVYLWCF